MTPLCFKYQPALRVNLHGKNLLPNEAFRHLSPPVSSLLPPIRLLASACPRQATQLCSGKSSTIPFRRWHLVGAILSEMPTEHIVALLIAERDRLNQAIEALQGSIKRRGRPPKNAATMNQRLIPKKRGRTFTAAQRKEQAKRMKEMWAKRKKKKND